jgi:predicted RND superfamily exporter protein/CRP-like cAMP-binding protein
MRRVLEFSIRRPIWVLLITLLVSGFFTTRIVDPTTGELKLRIDPSFDALMPDDAPERVYYDWAKDEFGDDQSLIIALILDDVFTLDNLHMIERISDLLEEAPGVDYVTSLATADHIGTQDESVETRPFLEPTPKTEADAERIRAAVHGNPVYAGNLVSPDSRATAFIVYVDDTPEQVFTDENLDLRMLEIVDEASGDAQVFISGTAHMRAANSRVLTADLSFMLPTVLLLMAVIALASFRSPRGVLVPLLAIMLSTLWTLGLMAWTDVPINLVTTIIPVLLLTVGFAYSVHVIADYYKALARDPSEIEAAGGPASWALQHVSLPVALTCLTTVAGFLSLTISEFPAIREFGLISVFGVTATTLLTLTLSPAVLQLLGPPKPKQTDVSATASPDRFDAWISRVGRFCIGHRREVLVTAGVICGLTLWGVYQIKIDTHLITNFSPEHPVRVHFEAINDALEGARPFSVVLQSDHDEAFLEPENLRALDELTQWLIEQPEIGGATSFADYVKLLSRAFNDDDPDFLGIPDDGNLIKQYLLFGETDELEDYVASNFQNALIRVRSKCETTREIAALVDRIEVRLAELPEHIQAGVTGNTVVLAQSIDAIASGQVKSLSIAAIFIFIILAILFASARMGFIGLIPNIMPVLLFFGLLGLTGVPLSAVTGLIACVVLGIAVDDTIHMMTRFNIEARERADERAGALAALASVARPVTITTVGLCLGFLVFTTGDLRNQTEFGALAALVLAFAWLVDITFTPALCSGLHIVTLWDALTYDLGEDPQKSIPIFAGLSKAQARIAALLTSVVKVSAGTSLFRAGEAGDSLCVVIDGELKISLRTADGGAVEFARARRGDVVGEVGLYHGKRTADVEALTDVRFLRLDAENLARLGKRYPRIGAQVLWNLSRVMADRLANASDREKALTIRLNELSTGLEARA